jgi:ABC-type multidrug transport system ATPase subunit
MGPNGTGKSTLLAVIAGLLWPLRGHVEIDGQRRRRTIEEERAIRRKVLYLPAEPWLPDEATGREFLLAVGRIYGIDDDRLRDHVDRLLKLFHLDPIAHAPLRSYSTGQRKKAALAGALVAETPVMILDEPFAGGLDPSGLIALRRVLQHLAERDDRTIVMASPVPELIDGLAHRVAVLDAGRIAVCDTPDNLRQAAGRTGPLGEILEHLTHPHTLEHIDHYLDRPTS